MAAMNPQPAGAVDANGKKIGHRGLGRPKGSLNKTSNEVRALAQHYGPAAIRKLAVLGGLVPKSQLKKGEAEAVTEAVMKASLDSLLSRAYGHPTQPLEHSLDESWEAVLDRVGSLPRV